MKTRLIVPIVATAVMVLVSVASCSEAPSIRIEETIGVTDSPQASTSPVIRVTETIGVEDLPQTILPVVIRVVETIGVSDFPRIFPPVAIMVRETVRVNDSPTLTPIQTQPPPPPIQLTVTVASPKAGVVWVMGTVQNIAWTTTGEDIAYVGIYYSTDGGKSMYTIAQQEYNDGTYIWKMPNTPSQTSLVRVIAYNDNGETLALGDSGLFIISTQ